MKLELLDVALCRTPCFSFDNKIEKIWDELKLMIEESSPAFYPFIAEINSVENFTCGEKTGFAIWKYFNRACYRATPYGRFAAITTVPVLKSCLPFKINSEISLHTFTNWNTKDTITSNITDVLNSSAWFQTNSSVYNMETGHRYLRFKSEHFEIAYVDGGPEIDSLLKFCEEKRTKKDIYQLMVSVFGLKQTVTDMLLGRLLNCQLLLSDQLPNITGQDYFERLRVDAHNSSNPYVISERKLLSGGLQCSSLDEVPELIGFLAANLPVNTNPLLDKFRREFEKKFDQKIVPLSVAMDPETGISYGDFINDPNDHELLDDLGKADSYKSGDLRINYTGLHQFLINRLLSGGSIRLENFKTGKASLTPVPNTISVMLRFWKDHLVIESAGGSTANSLLGRFTIASPELEKFGKEIAAMEENANPEILFFDVAYQAEKDVDNVNRRKQLYNFELPILTWSCMRSPVRLDEILVMVREGQVILWSKKYGKRMIPRIPSAYNYSRSDLSVYRLLCDLQHQSVRSDLNFRFQDIFPNLNHYPRVEYKGIILSPAMWLIPATLLNKIKALSFIDAVSGLKAWLCSQQINFLFKAGRGDQTLCFSVEDDLGMEAFAAYCRKHSNEAIYISEAFIANENAVSDETGLPYAAEIIVNYGHADNIYKACKIEPEAIAEPAVIPDFFLPGGNWLYYEIYCHQLRSDDLLINTISLFIKENHSYISKWFYIRYNDPGPHIRLRIMLKDERQGYLIMMRLKCSLQKEADSGLISDVQIKTYVREIKRYGADRIAFVEELFCTDSKYVLSLIKKKKTTEQLYVVTLTLMQRLLSLCFDTPEGQLTFVKQVAENFTIELELNHSSFKKINLRFQKLEKSFPAELASSFIPGFSRYEKQFTDIMRMCSKDERTKMLADLIHMHINRLFYVSQRLHEATLYHNLLKLLKSRNSCSAGSKRPKNAA